MTPDGREDSGHLRRQGAGLLEVLHQPAGDLGRAHLGRGEVCRVGGVVTGSILLISMMLLVARSVAVNSGTLMVFFRMLVFGVAFLSGARSRTAIVNS